MKNFTLSAATLLLSALSLSAASPKVGMLIGYESIVNDNPQESEAARWFAETFDNGVIITPSEIDKINTEELEALWVHIDRVGIGHGYANLPAEFNNENVKEALTRYVAGGGSLYLSKFATQMVHELGRIDAAYAPGIFGDGDGAPGRDVWCVNAYLGSVQTHMENADESQIYDRTSHPIYEGMESWAAHSEQIADYPHPAFPMLGTGTGEPIHREDHNCMWDLNSYEWTAEGKNTLEKLENQYDCVVIGTWGHVQDYCVAGIVEFLPTESIKGTIIANGLAACEWAPRTNNNAYHSNLTRLTENTLNYLASKAPSGIGGVAGDTEAEATYYNLQGMRITSPANGVFVKVCGGKAVKIVL